ncbi:DUF3363 domain-containing protein [Rhodophyticola porphyridii]|uniref:DUF3363 domain-containing protein n=1 Tax=Rhodophyticola porphyridii TaxID=1852017 RepID=UPI001F36FD96|nr:DUF3363 domain-containing protein [Rhodophyticola porphyridii]
MRRCPSPSSFIQCNFVSARLRRWCPIHRRQPRKADRNILAVTDSNGTYHPSRHIEIARAEKIAHDPERFVAAHVRRLKALRCAGPGSWNAGATITGRSRWTCPSAG